MNNDFRFQLEPGSRKHICPSCGKKRFVRYVDTSTGETLPEHYGRCDRAVNCGYHLNPYKDGYSKMIWEKENGKDSGTRATQIPKFTAKPPEPPKPISFIDFDIFKQSRKAYSHNNFVKWLKLQFDETTVYNLISRYHIGTSNHWPGATIFWQIDEKGRIHAGKIMQYNPDTGRRVKQPFNHISWVHKALKVENFNLKQCYFGEHLLSQEPQKPVGIVESEKTAIIATAYLPDFIWLAVGSLSNINTEKCQPLTGRKVVLFPDLNGFELWSQKAAKIQKELPGVNLMVSDLLERNCTQGERENGLDLADYLTRLKPEQFKALKIEPPPPEPAKPVNLNRNNFLPPPDKEPPPKPKPKTTQEPPHELWPVDELEKYFNSISLPPEPIQLNQYETITNPQRFVLNQISETKAHNGQSYFRAGFDRLLMVKEILKA